MIARLIVEAAVGRLFSQENISLVYCPLLGNYFVLNEVAVDGVAQN